MAYAAACEALGLPPDQVLMVGDNRTNDVDGARAAGLYAVHVTSAPGHDPADEVERIASVVELRL